LQSHNQITAKTNYICKQKNTSKMNDLKIYVNDNEIDYAANDSLPFQFSDKIDDLNNIGVIKSSSIVNSFQSISIPATKTNKAIFTGNTTKTLKVVKGSQQVASSKIRIDTISKSNNQIREYICDVFGGNAELIEVLKDVSLRDLSLGNQYWDNTEIQNTWSGSASTEKGIFAPVLYGVLDSATAEFSEVDLRFHVYFNTIIEGIADYLKITLVSNFFDNSVLWRKAVNVFCVGVKFQRATFVSGVGNIRIGDFPTLSVSFPNPINEGTYIITVKIPAGKTGLERIELTSSEGYDVDVNYDISEDLIFVTDPIFIAQGGFFTVSGYANPGNTPADIPNLSTIRLDMIKGRPALNGDFTIASCLQDTKITDWLKAIFQMYNLVSYYDNVTKTWTIEPRFEYKELATTRNGFYNNIKSGNFETIDLDLDDVTENLLNEIGFVNFKYKENEVLNTKIEGENIKDFKANSCKVTFNDNTSELDFESRIYHDAFLLNTILNNSGLLSMLPNDFVMSDNEGLPVATFEGSPVCALVATNTTNINYKTAITAAPLLMQSNQSDTGQLISLSFCDTTFVTGATTYIAKGLVSTFYQNWISSMLRYKTLSCKVNIKNINVKADWIKVYSDGADLYLRNSIDNFPVDQIGLSDCTFFKISGIFSTDSASLNMNSVVPVFSV
jgi:hypothetical protein